MRLMKSNEGIAIILALVLGLVSIGFLSAIMTMISTGGRMSGMERSYATAVEASRGGSDIIMKYLMRETDFSESSYQTWLTVHDSTLLAYKRGNPCSTWNETDYGDVWLTKYQNYGQVGDITGATGYPDISFSTDQYTIYVKIVDTSCYTITGTTDIGYIYTIHAVSISKKTPDDKSWITFVYNTEPSSGSATF